MKKAQLKLVQLILVAAIVCSLTMIATSPAGAIIAGFSVHNRPTTKNTIAEYSIGPFTVQPGTGIYYIPGVDNFTVTFPASTTLPTSMATTAITIKDNTTNQIGHPTSFTITGLSITLKLPTNQLAGNPFAAISNGDTVIIFFSKLAGIKNPSTTATNWVLSVSGAYTGSASGIELATTSGAYFTTDPIKGIDVSGYQTINDWQKVYDAGYRFAFTKATQGDTIITDNFESNMGNASKAGPEGNKFMIGPYHYADPNLSLEGEALRQSARNEASHFVNVAGPYLLKGGYLRPALDIEPDGGLGGVHCYDGAGNIIRDINQVETFLGGRLILRDRLSTWIREWTHTVLQETGAMPFIYTNPDFVTYWLDADLSTYGLWISPYGYKCAGWLNGPPGVNETGIWKGDWVFCQYYLPERCGINSIDGITSASGVDLDMFNGSESDLRDYLMHSGAPIDVFMLVDETGSFYDDLPTFKAQAPDIVSRLGGPYSNVRFGIGRFEDYPISPFGDAGSGDRAYQLLVNLTFNTNLVLNAISSLYTRYGMDEPESQLAALYQAATGEGQVIAGYPEATIPAGQEVHFRDGATKIIMLWTDAPFHKPGDLGTIPYPGPSFNKTVNALKALDPPMVIGISSGGGGIDDLNQIAVATGALAPAGGVDTDGDGIVDIPEGAPLVCTIGSSGYGLTEAIESLVEAAGVLPIADANGPYNGAVGDAIEFDGCSSFDADGSIVLYQWDFESDGVFDFSDTDCLASHTYPAAFSGLVTLRVTDNDGNTAVDTAPVEVITTNVAPVAEAGPDQTVERTSAAGAQVTLDGSGSYDPDNSPQPLSYSWTWAGGGSASGVSPTVTMPMGTTKVTLEVSDGALPDTDTVDITVQDTTPPIVTVELPTPGLAVQDGITLKASASDLSGVAAVYFCVREPNGSQGNIIGPAFEDLAATLIGVTGKWEYNFDTLKLPDGYYIALAKGVDTYSNPGWSTAVPFSIRNWAVIKLQPYTENNKPGRTMPVKFAIRVSLSVDPAQPFVYNEDLTIKIFAKGQPLPILQTSTFGSKSTDYRIDNNTLYITNFQTSKTAMEYKAEIYRGTLLVGSFTFKTTVK